MVSPALLHPTIPTPTPSAPPRSRPRAAGATIVLLLAAASTAAAQAPGNGGRVTFTDLMQVRQIDDARLSAFGRWVAYTAAPDRGNPEVVVRSTTGAQREVIALATDPVFSPDGAWLAARTVASLEARETAEDEDRLDDGVVLMALPSGTLERWDGVRRFAFSQDGLWLAVHHTAEPDDEDADGGDEGDTEADAEDETGTELVLRSLASGDETSIPDVTAFAFSSDGTLLAYAQGASDDARDGVRVRELASGGTRVADARADAVYRSLTWTDEGSDLAFFAAGPDPDDGGPIRGSIHVWSADGTETWADEAALPDSGIIPTNTQIEWSEDGRRLFFTWRPVRPDEREAMAAAESTGDSDADGDADAPFDAYDTEAILADRGVDVWHWQDPRIMTQQKVLWSREKDRTYRAVRHRSGDAVLLGDPELPDVGVPGTASSVALGSSDAPYRIEAMWEGGGRRDLALVDLDSGDRSPLVEGLAGPAELSPDGRFVVWWDAGHYHLTDVESGQRRVLTDGLGVPFADEDWDYPDAVPGYGIAGWTAGDEAVLIHDKYDVWVMPTDGSSPWSLTDGAGRADRRTFRLLDVDGPIDPDEPLLLSAYHDLRKNFGFYRADLDRAGVERLLEEDKRFVFVAAADSTDRVLFTREAYDEFPDLWVADRTFSEPTRISDVNPGLFDRFAWGDAELLEWTSLDGTPLQGVVIKPENYEEGRRYPVLVYYYRFFSQRLHEFNDPSVNHRPSFPVYASDGYVVFLPDVRFEVGRPGLAATKSVVPGVQQLIDVGIADPEAIALHGHSWSGYQTAFIVTQTDIFTTAIAGAPVANMTSAYSGIRLGSGLARQFQYERTQSRIGGSLWESLDEYIENSPVFFADRIETPMLILHGDVDDAVPWEQSIELFLAMRRLGKESVFLQYRDEPHHPQRYANKLDWATKMKEWVDHYLKGTPAPRWISEGVPYQGR
ncbi:MAG: prolyl oligopeptidase family serine peptidase [Gemmatimonadetes bacterium]|nr:prolyl oligopeptidase family serine peptidase [Gemmatimonadota bacterium]